MATDCSKIENLMEAALLVVANADLLRQWVNGSDTTDVTLGGKATPSIRKLVAQIDARESAAAQAVIDAGVTKISGYTSNASKYMGSASTYAATATSQAQVAGGYATSASTYASNASAYASNANVYKNSASTYAASAGAAVLLAMSSGGAIYTAIEGKNLNSSDPILYPFHSLVSANISSGATTVVSNSPESVSKNICKYKVKNINVSITMLNY